MNSLTTSLLTILCLNLALSAAVSPNIVIILTDDQGYADISFNPNHPKEVFTPHMDALAKEGVFFTQAYTSGHVCSPTRAGLMLGRYQQRVGVYTAGQGGSGFDPNLPIFPSFLPENYVSTTIGKWHLGLDEDFPALKWHAMNRGFDECYKFMGRGGHDYFKLVGVKGNDYQPIYRNKKRLSEGDYHGYLTTRLTEEAVEFIDREKDNPFFLYLAYNAVHSPAQAPQKDVDRYRKRFPDLTEKRAILMAMLEHLDHGVGEVVGKLKKEKVWEDTLLFFLTDNGGSKAMEANNGILNGFKGSLFEGGIRTPWIVSWPDRFKGGGKIDVPVISLDILPTTLDVLEIPLPEKNRFDGKSLLPLLTGKSTDHHPVLYWNSGEPKGEWAVRQGEWKAHGFKEKYTLHNLALDPSEAKDLKSENTDKGLELFQLHETWLQEMVKTEAAGKTTTTNKSTSRKLTKAERQAMREKRKAERARRSKRPNVLFVVCDDLNTHVSPSGYAPIHTPALHRFASESLTFRRSYCQYPVCGPSRASFLSGLYPESTGVLSNTLDIRETRPGTVSLPQRLKENGYWTASVGKVFHSSRHQHGEIAWHEQVMFQNAELPLVTKARKAFEKEHGSVEDRKNRKNWKDHLQTLSTQTRGQTQPGYGPTQLQDEQHKDGKNVGQVIEWLDDKGYGDKPFFIACGIQKPHVPFLAPQKYFDRYPPADLKFRLSPSNDWDDVPNLAMVKRFRSFGFELGKENDVLRREYIQAYHACVSFIDAQLGMLFDFLRKGGLWEDTIVIFTSDHGYHLGEHFMWGKVTLFEECARVPLVVRVPGMTKSGAVTQALVEHIDFYPSLLELCGLKTFDALQGTSFVPILKNPNAQGKDAAYTVVSRGDKLGRSIRTQRWRYAEWGSPNLNELYDLEKDPHEYENLAKDSGHKVQLQKMKELLQATRQRASRPKIN